MLAPPEREDFSRRGGASLRFEPALFRVARTSAQRGLLLHHKQDRDLPPACKLFQNPDVMIVICVQIAVTASASNALQGINHNEFCVRMLCQELLDLLFQPVLECVRHNCKMQHWRCIFRQVKESRLDTLERIFEAEIQNLALCHCKIPERLPLRNAQAKPQSQPRLADFRCTREDVQALWNKLIYQKVRRFVCPVLQIFRCDGFQFGHFFTSFRFYLL